MFQNNKIFILGFARSGYEAAKLLAQRGNEVLLNDGKEPREEDLPKIEELQKLGVKFFFGSHPDDLLDASYQYLIKNPGVPIDHKYVEQAHHLGIPVINEMEMAYQLLPKDKNICLIGITGTNGKTTTTTLIYEFLKKFRQGKGVHLAGNIGFPLCSFLNQLEEGDIIVAEVSCQQLENLETFRPDVAVLTNLSEAHLEFMKTYEHYTYVKSKLFQNQTSDQIAILNMGNDEVMRITQVMQATTKYFSSKAEINGAYLRDNQIYYYGEPVIDTKDILLRGVHNYENIMAALMVAKEFQVPNEIVREVLKTFSGVEHRLEFVSEIAGRKFYNDTEATNIKCTQIALSSFSEPVVLILGGYERGQNFMDLQPFVDSVKAIVAIGACRERVLVDGLSMGIPTYSFETLKEAFPKCYELSSSGDIILLSPASASWDQYKQCEDRGTEFKEYVEELKNEN